MASGLVSQSLGGTDTLPLQTVLLACLTLGWMDRESTVSPLKNSWSGGREKATSVLGMSVGEERRVRPGLGEHQLLRTALSACTPDLNMCV